MSSFVICGLYWLYYYLVYSTGAFLLEGEYSTPVAAVLHQTLSAAYT